MIVWVVEGKNSEGTEWSMVFDDLPSLEQIIRGLEQDPDLANDYRDGLIDPGEAEMYEERVIHLKSL